MLFCGYRTVLWTDVITDPNGEEIVGKFYEKELQKANQEKFRIKEVIKSKVGELYVKWKGYDILFNNWINKKDVIEWNYIE